MIHKAYRFMILFLLINFNNCIAQTSAWTTLTNPTSGILGQLYVKGGLGGNGITDTAMIQTLSGATSLQDSSFNSLKIQLTSALQFNHFRLVKGSYKNIVVDVIKDENVYRNDAYYANFFVISAKRADTVEVTIQKSDSIVFDPSSLLGDSLIKNAVKKVIPWLAEIKILRNTGSNIVCQIINPRVYFEAEIIQFSDRKQKFWEIPFSPPPPPGAGSYYDTLYRGEQRVKMIPFKGGILVKMMTMDTIIKATGDTTFSLGIDVSETVKPQCTIYPIPYRVPKSPYNLREEQYDFLDKLLLVSSSNDQYLFCYINIHAKKINSGIVFGGEGLSDSIILNYIIVKFKRLKQRTI